MQNAFAGSVKFILTGTCETVAKPLYAINMFRKIIRRADLHPIHPDALRSTFIRRACEAAINFETIAALTGMEAALIKRRFSGYFKTDIFRIHQIYSTFKPLSKNNRKMNLLILGVGGHGHTVKEIAEKLGIFQNILFLDDHASGKNVLATCNRYKEYISEYPCAFVAIGDNEIRRTYMQKLKSLKRKYDLPHLLCTARSLNISQKHLIKIGSQQQAIMSTKRSDLPPRKSDVRMQLLFRAGLQHFTLP